MEEAPSAASSTNQQWRANNEQVVAEPQVGENAQCARVAAERTSGRATMQQVVAETHKWEEGTPVGSK